MLSFGIEYDRAFSTAFWSARLLAGSGPPSRAATMIARESLEKSLPRRASATPFLCLIDDHLLCPDTLLLSHELKEELVDPGVVRELWVKRCHDESALAEEHGRPVQSGQHLDVRADLRHARRPDEHTAHASAARQLEVSLEARDLPAVRVSPHRDVDEAEVLSVEQDHPGAGAEHRPAELPHRLLEPVDPDQPHDRRRLPARDDEAVDVVELLRLADLHRVRAKLPQHRRVLPEIALDCEDADLH